MSNRAQPTGFRHVGGKCGAVHAEAVEDEFGFIDQGFGFRALEKLGQIGFAQLVDIVELAVGEKAGPSDPVEDIRRLKPDYRFHP